MNFPLTDYEMEELFNSFSSFPDWEVACLHFEVSYYLDAWLMINKN